MHSSLHLGINSPHTRQRVCMMSLAGCHHCMMLMAPRHTCSSQCQAHPYGGLSTHPCSLSPSTLYLRPESTRHTNHRKTTTTWSSTQCIPYHCLISFMPYPLRDRPCTDHLILLFHVYHCISNLYVPFIWQAWTSGNHISYQKFVPSHAPLEEWCSSRFFSPQLLVLQEC